MKTPLVPVAAILLAVASPAQGWVDKTPTSILQSPSARAFPAMCWDAAHGYVLLFGGIPYYGPGAVNETWTWNGTAWTRRITTAPTNNGWTNNPARTTAMTFHPPTNEVVMVHDGSTWIWTGTDWLLHPATIPTAPWNPPVAGNIALAHDPVHNQTVLYVGTRFGGGGSITFTSETFLWDGLGWTLRPTPTVPWPNEQPTMAFDPVAGRLVLTTNGQGASSYYEWTGANWQQRLPAGAPTAMASSATDTTNQRLVLFDGVLNQQPNHTWTMANGVAQQLSTPLEPARRIGTAMAYDPVRQRIVLFGGAAVWNFTTSPIQVVVLGDTWEFQLGAGASYTSFGAGCLGSRGVPGLAASGNSLPRVGQMFQATVTNLPFTSPTFMFLGLSNTSYGPTPLPLSLGFLGAPSCSLLCSGDDLSLVTNVLGTGLWQWPIPNVPGASFYNQAIVFDAAANPLGITTSNGAHGVVGF